MTVRMFSIILLPLVLSGCEQARSASPDESATALAAGQSGFVTTSVGRVDSAGEARQLVASADGMIRSVLVERGQRVHAGQVLLTVDCGPRLAASAARRAQAEQLGAAADTVLAGPRAQQVEMAGQSVRIAQAARADAADRLDQARSLAGQGFISRRELAARQNALTAADAALHEAMAQASLVAAGPRASERRGALAGARAAGQDAAAAVAQADQCNLRSPIDGEVLQILRREGEFSGASQGTPLIVVGDMTHLVVRAEINERDAAGVKVGQRAEVWIEGSATRWPGHIGSLAQVMGRRSARALDPTDRFDRDVREAFVVLDGPLPPALVGLRVMVGVKP